MHVLTSTSSSFFVTYILFIPIAISSFFQSFESSPTILLGRAPRFELMPDKRPPGNSPPKPPMPLPKTVGEGSRQVHFEPTKSTQPNGIRHYQATVEEIEDDNVVHHRPMKTAAEKGKTVEQPSTDKPKDIQPSAFPAVGAPPHTHAGAGPWLMAPNPAQSLGWPAGGQMYGGQQFQPSMAAAMPPWAGVHGPVLADGSPAAQFYAPPSHLVNNIAYSAFTPPFFQVRFSYLFPLFRLLFPLHVFLCFIFFFSIFNLTLVSLDK
ncbi:hypothetical protein VHEMI07701 [[Torrubiella] hemipterigena]|uniref:Uncharacterized protein n=1 Tax=[Torrubiella] hemipterigena TaxID=1531966 RepID=A0A0A1T498_9HYPO|nr:hypothetical protein VHEMI07701 [[Torrubiella] hemipterigena]